MMNKTELAKMAALENENNRLRRELSEIYGEECTNVDWSAPCDVLKSNPLPQGSIIRFLLSDKNIISVRIKRDCLEVRGTDCIAITPAAANAVEVFCGSNVFNLLKK